MSISILIVGYPQAPEAELTRTLGLRSNKPSRNDGDDHRGPLEVRDVFHSFGEGLRSWLEKIEVTASEGARAYVLVQRADDHASLLALFPSRSAATGC
jgi:hypothetical protein